MIRGLVDQDVILAGKQPCQRAGRERVAPVAEQVGSGAADDEVDLQLEMAMGGGSNVAGPVANHASLDASRNSEVVDHRKKR